MLKLSTKRIALIAVYAAILVVVSRLPGIPIVAGAKAGSIELTVPLYPIIGILFGPFVGALAALIGNIVIFLIPKLSVFGLLTIPAGALSALVGGFLTRREKPLDWKAAAIVLAGLIFCWYIPFPNPQQVYVGLEAPFYPIPMHVPALALVLIFRHKISDFINSSRRRIMALGVGLASYIAIMTEHMWGNLMFAYLYFPYYVDLKGFRDFIRAITSSKELIGMGFASPKTVLGESSGLGDYFMLWLPFSAVERAIFLAVAMVIGVAVIRMIGGYLQVLGVTPLKIKLGQRTSE